MQINHIKIRSILGTDELEYKPESYWSQDTLQAIRQADAGGPLE